MIGGVGVWHYPSHSGTSSQGGENKTGRGRGWSQRGATTYVKSWGPGGMYQVIAAMMRIAILATVKAKGMGNRDGAANLVCSSGCVKARGSFIHLGRGNSVGIPERTLE